MGGRGKGGRERENEEKEDFDKLAYTATKYQVKFHRNPVLIFIVP